jgi:hypothetical protein
MAAITFGGGNGHSLAKANILEGAKGEDDGIASEYDWVAKNRLKADVVEQQLLGDNGKVYDLLILQAGGKTEKIYFDITGYFGKY